MTGEPRKVETLDFAGAFEQGWIQYRSNFFKFFIAGVPVSVPAYLFFSDIAAGIFLTLALQGFFFMLLADVISGTSSGRGLKFLNIKSACVFFVRGFFISLFLLPFLAAGFALLVIPGVFLFSVFMFSFFYASINGLGAVDSCLESMRCGAGYRLSLFLFSLIFFSSMAVAFMISELFPPLFIFLGALLFPYFFSVIFEFYEQLENK
ncbi:MAG TPA: hypothetical protein P5044_00075 [bacterium]|nr:hypothetical protein [bacterium]